MTARGGVVERLPTQPVANTPEEELLLLSSSDRRRAIWNASSSSSGADEPSESPAALCHSCRSDSLSDMAGGGRRSGFAGKWRGRESTD